MTDNNFIDAHRVENMFFDFILWTKTGHVKHYFTTPDDLETYVKANLEFFFKRGLLYKRLHNLDTRNKIIDKEGTIFEGTKAAGISIQDIDGLNYSFVQHPSPKCNDRKSLPYQYRLTVDSEQFIYANKRQVGAHMRQLTPKRRAYKDIHSAIVIINGHKCRCEKVAL